ncbi:SRPBCC family protein [Corynebacterium sp. 335C]
MADRTKRDIVIEAEPRRILDVIGDAAAYPEWAAGTSAGEVTAPGDAPLRPRRARFTLSTVLTDVFEVEYDWTDDGVSWTLVSSEMQKTQDGAYRLEPAGDGATRVTYELQVATKVPMLGMLRRKAENRIIETALTGLKARVESGAGA